MPLPLDLKGRPDERVLRQLVAALLFEGTADVQLKNCGIRIYTGVCYGPAISFSRGWITERHSRQPIGIGRNAGG